MGKYTTQIEDFREGSQGLSLLFSPYDHRILTAIVLLFGLMANLLNASVTFVHLDDL